MDIFDGSSGLWSTAAFLLPWDLVFGGYSPEFVATSLPIQGLAIIAGVYIDNDDYYHTAVISFDGNIRRWSITELNIPRSGLAATSLPNQGLAFFAGGLVHFKGL